jgi:hypothetical protein
VEIESEGEVRSAEWNESGVDENESSCSASASQSEMEYAFEVGTFKVGASLARLSSTIMVSAVMGASSVRRVSVTEVRSATGFSSKYTGFPEERLSFGTEAISETIGSVVGPSICDAASVDGPSSGAGASPTGASVDVEGSSGAPEVREAAARIVSSCKAGTSSWAGVAFGIAALSLAETFLGVGASS